MKIISRVSTGLMLYAIAAQALVTKHEVKMLNQGAPGLKKR